MRPDLFGWLGQYGISGVDAQNVASSFAEPIYEQRLELGDVLYQYVRNPSATHPDIRTGRYFALAGATTESLGIFDGASGRTLQQYVVIHPFVAIEGTARDRASVSLEARASGKAVAARDWDHALDGSGGATQIFVPYSLLGHLRCEGSAERRSYEWFRD